MKIGAGVVRACRMYKAGWHSLSRHASTKRCCQPVTQSSDKTDLSSVLAEIRLAHLTSREIKGVSPKQSTAEPPANPLRTTLLTTW